MGVIYRWEWGPMKVADIYGLTDVITGIDWKCIAIDEETGIEGFESGHLHLPEPNAQEFVTLLNVNNKTVNEWIEAHLNLSEIEAICAGHIESLKSPLVKTINFPTE